MKKFVLDKINNYIPYLENNYPIFLENSERLIEFNFNFDDIVTKFIEHYEALASKKREIPFIVDNSINDRFTESKLIESNQIKVSTTNNNIAISKLTNNNNIQSNNNIPNIQSISNISMGNIPINSNQNNINNNQINSIQNINNNNQSNNNKNNNQSNNNNQSSNNNSQNINNLTEKPVLVEHENLNTGTKTEIVNLLQKEEPTILSKNEQILEVIDIDGLPIRKDFSEESSDSLIHTNDKMFLETVYTKKSKLDLTHNDVNIIDGMMLNDNDLETFLCALEKNEYFEGKLLFVEQHLSDEVLFFSYFKSFFL